MKNGVTNVSVRLESRLEGTSELRMKRKQLAQVRKDNYDSQKTWIIEEALGNWEVKYPGPDGMIREDYTEKLELKRDGTYSWNPSPVWAPAVGEWGVVKTEDRLLKLCFKDMDERWRWGYLVLIKLGRSGTYFMNWTRTRGDAVIFADRIFRADRLDKH